MAERRETDRGRRQPSRKPAGKTKPQPAAWADGDRIAKFLAHAGVCSRRDAEVLIEEGIVSVNGRKLDSPAFKVHHGDVVKVRGKVVRPPEPTRLWRYHKPAGLLTATRDPEGRPTIFDHLPKSLPRVVTVGRLDLTTEGLLLLTNDGELARGLELPSTGLERHYRARAFGEVTEEGLTELGKGVVVDGEHYAPIKAELERTTGANNWLSVTLSEGKNREVRKALSHIGLTVNRLIRTSYGPFELGDLKSGTLDEVSAQDLEALIKPIVSTERLEKRERAEAQQKKTRPGSRSNRVHRRGK